MYKSMREFYIKGCTFQYSHLGLSSAWGSTTSCPVREHHIFGSMATDARAKHSPWWAELEVDCQGGRTNVVEGKETSLVLWKLKKKSAQKHTYFL